MSRSSWTATDAGPPPRACRAPTATEPAPKPFVDRRRSPDLGVTTPTLFAFSSYNWLRAPGEVAGLMRLLGDYLKAEDARMLIESGARLRS